MGSAPRISRRVLIGAIRVCAAQFPLSRPEPRTFAARRSRTRPPNLPLRGTMVGMAAHGKEGRDHARDCRRIANTRKAWRESMTGHLTKLAFACIALAFAAAAPVGAQGARKEVVST